MFHSSFSESNAPSECPSRNLAMERKWNGSNNVESAPNCPRCASSNTKFCYYNNYSLSQPRYFCKGCRRYWTKGGSLRNVPVGGGCRKSRKSKSARQAAAERAGLSYQLPSPGSASEESNSGGADIDLAAVFAKFLNHDSPSNGTHEEGNNISVNDQESSSSGVSYSSVDLVSHSFDPEFQIETGTLGFQEPYDYVDGGYLLHEGLPPLCMDGGNFEEIFHQTSQEDAVNFQAILGNEIAADPDIYTEATGFPDLEWQSVMQFQDFATFSNDQGEEMMKNTASNLADH